MAGLTYSIIIPVYRNEASVEDLLHALEKLAASLEGGMEAVFVVDGSPDLSWQKLRAALPACRFSSQLIAHSRNFGSFAAIRTGLEQARGAYSAVLSADLQEPLELIQRMFAALQQGQTDVIIASRRLRGDPWVSALASRIFWRLYRWIVQPEMPPNGMDVFACNATFSSHLRAMRESNTTLVGLVLWMGFRRELMVYDRLPRRHGRSAWSLTRKLRYMGDSFYAFSDWPIYALLIIGVLGVCTSLGLTAVVLFAKFHRDIAVPGYAATMITVIFFGGFQALGLGLLGGYLWRTFENTKSRPASIVMAKEVFPAP